jgi:amidase
MNAFRALTCTSTFAALCVLTFSAAAKEPIEIRQAGFIDPLTTQVGNIAEAKLSSEAATRAALDRIEKIDRSGPKINSIIAVNPNAIAIAKKLDSKQKRGEALGILHGAPVLLKDNIESADPMATTAGSLALKNNITNRDSTVAAKLRAAGAVILGKTNLSEWANIRSSKSTSGWSAIGGLTRNPHVLDRNACGSSSGSAAAVAAGLAFAAIGTETDGSITCPASVNGIVGFKPSVGMISRRHIIPISHSQDTAGPMTQTVSDAALIMTALAGSDPNDPATADADKHLADFVVVLDLNALRGTRVGLVDMPGVDKTLQEQARARLRSAGATVVDVSINPQDYETLGNAEFDVLQTELKAGLQSYLQSTDPAKVKVRSLADVIAFNAKNAGVELKYFGQETFEAANKKKGLKDPSYLASLSLIQRLSQPEGLDLIFARNQIQILVGQTNSPAWLSTLGKGDDFKLPSMSRLPAVAGYPHLTVPLGKVGELPVGLSFIGPKWTDAQVLAYGFAFEQGGRSLRVRPKFLPSVK